jgi:2-polyprenyl-3-methyl-5-hydroxy-6-metoxy-1,4-benzoquinol methylase
MHHLSGSGSLGYMRTYELTECPACSGDHFQPVAVGAEALLRRCDGCDLVFAPAYADPAEIYVDGYMTGETDFGLDVMDPLFQEYLAHVAHRRFALIEKVTPPGRVLDVGCGTGEVLAVARARGWEVQGVEPVEASAAFAANERALDVRVALLEESGLPECSYDVVTAFHVLEHMTDGLGFLRMIARWAKPGGHVVVEVPNWRSVHRRAFGGEWPGLRPLEHVAHYAPATLRATIRRAGLDPVSVLTPGYIWTKQTLGQVVADLGATRLDLWMQRARVLTRIGQQDGRPAVVPNQLGWWALNALQSGYGLTRTGMVVLGIARVPEGAVTGG